MVPADGEDMGVLGEAGNRELPELRIHPPTFITAYLALGFMAGALFCGGAWAAAEQELEVVVVYGVAETSLDARSITQVQPARDAAAGAMTSLTGASVSLQATTPDNKNTGIYLRGLGTTAFNDGMSGSVKLLQDGIYLGRQGMFPTRLYDIAQVNIQRGPSIDDAGPAGSAGSIHIRTREPDWKPEYAIGASLGSDGLRGYEYTASGPLMDGVLAGRLSGYHLRREGTTFNETSKREVNAEHHQAVRGQLLWQPDERLSSRLILEHSRLADDCCAYSVAHYSNASQVRARGLGHELLPVDPTRRRVRQDGTNQRVMTQDAATLRLRWSLNRDTELLGISGWRGWRYDSSMDLDGIDLPIVHAGGWEMDHRQWSQELRLSGRPNPRFAYELGALYLEQEHDGSGNLTYGPAAASWFLAQPLPPGILEGSEVQTSKQQTGRTSSLFGRLDWSTNGGLQVSGILRYSRDTRQGTGSRQVGGMQSLPADPVMANLARLLRGLALGEDQVQRASTGGEQLDIQLALDYPLGRDLLASLSWTSAHKPGGVNGEIVTGGVSPTFGAEQGKAVAAGLAWRPPAVGAQLQLTLYHQQIADYQALTYNPDSSPLNPQMNNIINIDRVRVRGIELEGQAGIGAGVRLSAGAAYNDARYQRFTNAPCPPESGRVYCDYSGMQMVNAPRWTAFAKLEHHYPLAWGALLYSGLNYQWRSGYYGTTERGRGSEVDDRAILDVHMGLRQRNWDLRLWVHNVLDEGYIAAIYALTGGGDYGALIGKPRTVGMTVSLDI